MTGSSSLPPGISIITVYYNSPEEVLALHRSMQEHLPNEQFEWIVADNSSIQNLSEQLAGARYLRFTENYGFAKANNLAVKTATAPYLFFVNPDCLFIENCLPALIEAVQRAAVCGPKVINEDGSLQLSFGPFLSIRNELVQQRRMKRENSATIQRWIQSKGESFVDYVSGCALMISAAVYREIGGFDEKFFLYEEDVDLCKRIESRGLRTMYVPSAVILHKRNRAVLKEPDRSRHEYRRSQIYYYKKHHGRLQNTLLKLYLYVRRSWDA
jgi:GT2 family glycosyltransferase